MTAPMTRAAAATPDVAVGATITERLEAFRRGPDVTDQLTILRDGAAPRQWSLHRVIDHARGVAAQLRAEERAGDTVIVLSHGSALYGAFLGAIMAGRRPSLWAPPSPKMPRGQYDAMIAHQLATVNVGTFIANDALRDIAPDAWLDPASIEPSSRPFDGAPADPNDVAFLQYSSGTTGAKKAVAITHRAALWNVDRLAETIDARGNRDRIVSWLPLYHDMGLVACLLLPFLRRIPLVAQCPFEWVARPASWLEAITVHRGTLGWLPNFAYGFLAERTSDLDAARLDLRSLRGIVNCSEPVRAASHDRFLERFARHGLDRAALAVSYAMAECTFAVTSGGFGVEPLRDVVDAERFRRDGIAAPARDERAALVLLSSGTALPGTTIEIVDAAGALRPDRALGEIVVSSPSAGTYVAGDGHPLTRHATGDLGYLADGHLVVTGRADDRLNIHGCNLWPDDLEAIAGSVDGATPGRACAIAVPNDTLGTDDLVLLVETDDDAAPAVRAAVHAAIEAHVGVAPADVHCVPPRWLQKSSSGKLARAANRERYRAALRPASVAVVDAPVDDAGDRRARVRSIVVAALRAPAARDAWRDDQSLSRDGAIDSLAFAGVLSALEQAFGVALDARGAELDTVDAIVAALEQPADAAPARGEPVPRARADIELTGLGSTAPTRRSRLWTAWFRWRCRRLGISVGRNVAVLGPVLLRIDGDARRITIGDDVTIMPGVDLKVRENGRIVIHDGAALDTNARLVAARDGTIELGERGQIAMGTIVNAGADVIIGRRTATAAYCTIAASEHCYLGAAPIMEQGYRHEPVLIGADVWIGASVFIGPGSRIGDGAVIGTGSVVRGDVPGRGVFVGQPGRVIRFRAAPVSSPPRMEPEQTGHDA